MALSLREQQVLREIEATIRAADPEFIGQFTTAGPADSQVAQSETVYGRADEGEPPPDRWHRWTAADGGWHAIAYCLAAVFVVMVMVLMFTAAQACAYPPGAR